MSKTTSNPVASNDALLKLASKATPYQRTRKSKLDSYADTVKALLAKDYTAKAIVQFLKDNGGPTVTPITVYLWKKRNVAQEVS